MQMSPESAAKVMTQFTDTEAEEIAGEIVKLRKVDSDVTEQIMKDFHQAARQPRARPGAAGNSPRACWRPPSARNGPPGS